MAKYTLTDTMHARILTEIQARRTGDAGSTTPGSAGSAAGTSDGAAPAGSADAGPLAPGHQDTP